MLLSYQLTNSLSKFNSNMNNCVRSSLYIYIMLIQAKVNINFPKCCVKANVLFPEAVGQEVQSRRQGIGPFGLTVEIVHHSLVI